MKYRTTNGMAKSAGPHAGPWTRWTAIPFGHRSQKGRSSAWLGAAAAVLLGTPLVGCNQQTDTRFVENGLVMAVNEVPESIQTQIAEITTAVFGTPNEPFVPPGSGLEIDRVGVPSPGWKSHGANPQIQIIQHFP